MRVATGLDRLLADPEPLAGRRYGLLSHLPAVTADLVPAHLALAERTPTPPAVLLGPEHGFYGVEQDMVASDDEADPWTGVPVRSLYGSSVETLRPAPGTFQDLDLLVVDLQDVGARYYTYAASAVWSALAAVEEGCEVWVLDRPNPLGGEVVEGNQRGPGLESFVGAFSHPTRHGMTLGELVLLELARAGRREEVTVWAMEGWERSMHWPATGRPWIAPSPNMPSYETALVFPGLCLLESTSLSEGRGTTRPFLLFGAPGLDPRELAARLAARRLPGLGFLPTYFRPQFHKHAGERCGGVEVVVREATAVAPYRAGVEALAVLWELAGGEGFWRREPYEFVGDRPSVDLLAGSSRLREGLADGGDLGAWIASWPTDEGLFRAEREEFLLYGRPS